MRELDFSAEQLPAEACLQGGGEMGALMRAMDWSKTPVGPVENWPQSLRTAISIMLESRFGMYIAWGPEYTQFYNDGYRPILGATKHPAIGKSTTETFREIWSIIGPLFENVRRGVAVGRDDFHLPLERYGFAEECYFTLSYSPIRDESGGVGGVHVTVTETTQRVLGERRLRILRDLAARASETETEETAWESALEVLRESVFDIPFALLYALQEGGRRASLKGSCSISGEKAAPRLIDLDSESESWPIAAAAQGGGGMVCPDVRARFGSLIGTQWPEPVEKAVVLPIRRPGSAEPYGILIAGVSPRLALDEQYSGFLDLTAQHIATAVANARARDEERRRTEALQELDRAKTAFFSNVSHEFRTPLTLLLGPLEELLESEPRGQVGRRGQLEVIHRNTLRLLKLVNTLLDFSRLEAGRAQAIFEPVDLAALTAEVSGMFRSAIERAQMQFVVDCKPLGDPVFVDREMWEKIVLNLLSNAFKFTFSGEIRVSLKQEGEEVCLEVSDTGVGIPGEALPHLFKRFHRVYGTRSRTHEGSGIGLALVQELVTMHGGRIEVESELDQGTTFRVTLPMGSRHLPQERLGARRELPSTAVRAAAFLEEALRWLPEAGADQRPTPAKKAPGEHSGSPTGSPRDRILVVDDNADMRDYLRRILEECWTVRVAPDGESALAAALDDPPDLVLTDVMMPGLDGFQLLERLRSNPQTAEIPVVMLSARAGEEASVSGLDSGADDYLIKPFSSKELIARLRSQLAILHARRQLSRRRQELYSLFMQAPAPICVVRGPKLVFEMANPQYLKIVGRSDIVGQPLFKALPEMRGQGFDRLVLEVMRTGEPFIGKEFPVKLDRDGRGSIEDTYFTFIYSPLRNAAGTVERVMCLCYEVTDQVLARRKAESANRAKDEFLAILGHELRNPLAPIVTALHLMSLRSPELSKERMIIERQVQHMVRLVEDLLDVSRITRGKVQLRRKPVELASIVAKALETASPALEAKNHHLSLSVPAFGLTVNADEIRLAQVIANLLTNAARYTEPGGKIEVEAHAEEDRAILCVRDNGVGIPPELLPQVFDMFVQSERTAERSQSGLGLGLTIVKTLTELHGGEVSVHSDGVGQGSEFKLSLPLEPAVQPEAVPVLQVPALPSVTGRSSRRVLVVDDNRDACETLAAALELYGHRVRTVLDGPSALEAAESFRPHVVLLDIGLPVMDGYEVARALRRRPGLGHTRIIAVTGYGQENDRARSAEAGFDLHLIKPLDLTAVNTIVSSTYAAPNGE